jgi:phenylalanyl-tRNA synthetase alpha chain
MFHQVEGFMVDKKITFGDLKGVLSLFLRKMFGSKTKVRFRPSYFPFTEPSVEIDIECQLCKGKGCRVCKESGWVEILGAGMIDPEVFKAVKYDPEKYSGFAFGIGIERITMLKYAIDDIRLFFDNNMLFLKQF